MIFFNLTPLISVLEAGAYLPAIESTCNSIQKWHCNLITHFLTTLQVLTGELYYRVTTNINLHI